MQTLALRLAERSNNFDFLRWLAASLVIVSHEYALAGDPGAEPLVVLTRGFTSMGSIGVDVFFVVSGFLVTGSLLQRRSLVFFVASRAIRVAPALAVVLTLSALVLGPLLTELPWREYFSDSRTYTYVTRNLGLVDMQWNLPGVFPRSAAPHAVNGSLWSLLPETEMYAYLVVLGAVAALRWNLGGVIVAGGMIAAMAIAWSRYGDLAGTMLEPVTLARLAPYFALGSLAWCLRRWVPHSWALPVAAGAFAFAAQNTAAFVPAFAVTLALTVLWLAYVSLGPLARWGRIGDFSYGLYIFAYPVQQTLVAMFPDWSLAQQGVAAYAVTLLCAVGSWKLVEAPALRLKRFLPRQQGAGAARDRPSRWRTSI